MTKTMTTVLGASLLFAGATFASAQETRPIGLSIRGGLFFGEGDSDLAFGAELKVKDVNWEGIGSGYLGSITVSADHFGNTTPVMLNFVARNAEWYWTGGAGVMFGERRVRGGFEVAWHRASDVRLDLSVYTPALTGVEATVRLELRR